MTQAKKKQSKWPLYLIGSSAAVAVWSGWVGLGGLTGFGPVHLLPGIWDAFVVNTAITLPIGVEAYGAYALGTWINPATPKSARKFAKRSAIGSLLLGMLGQIAYHLLTAAHRTMAPWEIVTTVSCLPVVTLGLAAALHHLRGLEDEEPVVLTNAFEGGTHINPAAEIERNDINYEDRDRPMPKLEALLAEKPPWEAEPQWAPPRPMFVPVDGPETDAHPQLGVSVRSPLGRVERKMDAGERLAGRRVTGSFDAVKNTGQFPVIPE